jgi:hypothetical protein
MKILNTIFAATLLLLFGSINLSGQETGTSPISTDRPSIGTGTDLVPVGAIQLESGISWNRDQAATTFDGPESFLRIGMSNRIELQTTLPNMHWTGELQQIESEDVSIGAKFKIGSENWSWPVSVAGAVSLPTGSKELTSGGVDPFAVLTTQHNLAHGLQFSNTLDIASVSTEGAGRSMSMQIATDMGWCVTQKSCLYLESAPFIGTAQNASGFTADGGMTWRIAPLLQLDWRVGATVQGNDRTTFASIGYSMRRDHNFHWGQR